MSIFFPLLPVCVYKFSSRYLNNIIFIDNSFRASSERIILYYALLGSVFEYESKHMELVKVPYVEDHENALDYLNVLCTADLGPLDELL